MIRDLAVQPFVVVRLVHASGNLDVLHLAFVPNRKFLDGARPVFHWCGPRLFQASIHIDRQKLALIGKSDSILKCEKPKTSALKVLLDLYGTVIVGRCHDDERAGDIKQQPLDSGTKPCRRRQDDEEYRPPTRVQPN